MTNPYSMGVYQPTPYQQQPMYYNGYNNGDTNYPTEYRSQTSPASTAIKTAGIGGVAGGIIGAIKYKNPISKDGTISDTFTKAVFEKNLKKNTPQETKEFITQLNNVLKKLDSINSPEKIKELLNKNAKVLEKTYNGISSEAFLDAINSTNIKTTKLALKEALTKLKDFELVKTRNAIALSWDSESKKFIKTPEFRDAKLFEIIKNTKLNLQLRKGLKYAGIGALAAGSTGFILNKIFLNKVQRQ